MFRMIKKGIELQIISPSASLAKRFSSFTSPVFSVCSVCKSRSLFLCHMICKYRQATFDEFEEFKKGGVV